MKGPQQIPAERVHLAAALEWLNSWESIGGGITITATGTLSPWRMRREDEERDWGRRCAKAEVAEKLLSALVGQPELIQPIRVILSTAARRQAAKAVAEIKDRKS